MTTDHPSAQETFGERLRRWRRARRLSQGAFGQLLEPKVRPSTVSCWEKGLRHPSHKFLAQIVAITGIPAHLALEVQGSSQQASHS
ncbi:MAG TPA: helix-turn-helix domain-containing protein [Thermoanaerobaculia bacterium]|nr:helix-turn-helix domain-containing protein [Thermoanaerobaculia bacterium]